MKDLKDQLKLCLCQVSELCCFSCCVYTVDVYGPVCIHWMYMALCVYTGCIWPCVYTLWMYMALYVYTGCIWPCVYTLWMYMALCVYTGCIWPCVYTLRMYGPVCIHCGCMALANPIWLAPCLNTFKTYIIACFRIEVHITLSPVFTLFTFVSNTNDVIMI